ncbi:MAG: hypothetical protein NC314_06065 [Roseburia sp.]|nr:hypothetical protein [Ruminococcus sp.]MCM1156014.1 hypothetical protein [Roseburia sp.]MCM1242389.1 hypothetical protein [Roseburia sp.]
MKKKGISFIILVILSVLIIVFCTTETVMSQSKTDDRRKKQYYAKMEETYYADISALLAEKGYSGSGITLRWVSDDGESRVYTVMIHHRGIDVLSVQEKETLMQELSQAEFEDINCSFHYEFITA